MIGEEAGHYAVHPLFASPRRMVEVSHDEMDQVLSTAQQRALLGVPAVYDYIDGVIRTWPRCADGWRVMRLEPIPDPKP